MFKERGLVEEEYYVFLGVVGIEVGENIWLVEIFLNNFFVFFKVDIGVDVIIIFESVYNLLYLFFILVKLSKILFGLVDIVFFSYGFLLGKIM